MMEDPSQVLLPSGFRCLAFVICASTVLLSNTYASCTCVTLCGRNCAKEQQELHTFRLGLGWLFPQAPCSALLSLIAALRRSLVGIRLFDSRSPRGLTLLCGLFALYACSDGQRLGSLYHLSHRL
jgi:hypothetical protein